MFIGKLVVGFGSRSNSSVFMFLMCYYNRNCNITISFNG